MRMRFSSDGKRNVDQAIRNTTLYHKKSNIFQILPILEHTITFHPLYESEAFICKALKAEAIPL
jgi:hypothetical protein